MALSFSRDHNFPTVFNGLSIRPASTSMNGEAAGTAKAGAQSNRSHTRLARSANYLDFLRVFRRSSASERDSEEWQRYAAFFDLRVDDDASHEATIRISI